MPTDPEAFGVLSAYPDCRPEQVEPLGSAGGFSGAKFWRVRTRSGLLCLRRWPLEQVTADRLEFIQAVLWHVVREGFDLVPLPLCARSRKGYVHHAGHFWELSPWMPGKADFWTDPREKKLAAAMEALAEFHLAAATFPLPDLPAGLSPGITTRLAQLRRWLAGDLDHLAASMESGLWPELERRAETLFRRFRRAAGDLLPLLQTAARSPVPIQPCIRDVWHNHVLFEGDRVSGLIDFGSLAPDNVAADVARLLGSMARDNARLWQVGLASYRSRRPLSESEISLVYAFDRSTVVMAGLNWIDWVYRQRRVFESPAAVLDRLDDLLARLERLAGN